MIGTGPAENRLDDAEAVNAIPLSDPDIIVVVSLPSKRYCVRSEFPVGRRLRRSDQLSRSMLAPSIALRFQAHDWAPAWPEGARYRAEQQVIASSYSFSSRPYPSISRTHGRSLPTSTVGLKRAQGNAEERMRPNTRAIIAANPDRPPGTNAGAKFKSRRGTHPKGTKLNTYNRAAHRSLNLGKKRERYESADHHSRPLRPEWQGDPDQRVPAEAHARPMV